MAYANERGHRKKSWSNSGSEDSLGPWQFSVASPLVARRGKHGFEWIVCALVFISCFLFVFHPPKSTRMRLVIMPPAREKCRLLDVWKKWSICWFSWTSSVHMGWGYCCNCYVSEKSVRKVKCFHIAIFWDEFSNSFCVIFSDPSKTSIKTQMYSSFLIDRRCTARIYPLAWYRLVLGCLKIAETCQITAGAS